MCTVKKYTKLMVSLCRDKLKGKKDLRNTTRQLDAVNFIYDQVYIVRYIQLFLTLFRS